MELKKLGIEQLMNIEVSSVSRFPEKLQQAASAIQVITNEDIHRSGATRLPEALRLASNLIVAQSNSHDWGITARGFNGAPLANNTSANKLLVMIDGRTVCTPLFGGVFWDVQNVLLEDVDRIEVISGPGGTLWGPNAVNGVINIVTKRAGESKGLYASVALGTYLKDHIAIRYGTHVGHNLFFRIYGQRFDQDGTQLAEGKDGMDKWDLTQGGFRLDYTRDDKNTFTLQSNAYGGKEEVKDGDFVDGQNALARWTHSIADHSNYSVQLYYDRTWRYLPEVEFSEQLQTYDLDWQHRFPISQSNHFMYGFGYRVMDDQIRNTDRLSFIPANRTLRLFSTFFQDRIIVIRNKLDLTIGTKLLRNDYTGWEWQPGARLAWTADLKNTLWVSLSKTVRTPTRWDVDEVTPFLFTPSGGFKSETAVTYEAGYRVSANEKLSFSLAAYFNKLSDLRSININPDAPPAYLFANDQKAESLGLEFVGNYHASENVRFRIGYLYLKTEIRSTVQTVIPGSDQFEAIDPKSQLIFQSNLDLFKNIQLDVIGRFVQSLKETIFTPRVPAYSTFDIRLGYRINAFEFAVIGKNLLERSHTEFGSHTIPRSVHGRITCRL